MQWLRMPAERFLVEEDPEPEPPEAMAELAPLLRAGEDLDESEVETSGEVIKATPKPAASKREERE